MAKRESITFLGQEYQLVTNGDPERVDRIYVHGKVRIETWWFGGACEASLDYDCGNVEITNQRSRKVFKTESAALRDLETNARKLLRALGVEI